MVLAGLGGFEWLQLVWVVLNDSGKFGWFEWLYLVWFGWF